MIEARSSLSLSRSLKRYVQRFLRKLSEAGLIVSKSSGAFYSKFFMIFGMSMKPMQATKSSQRAIAISGFGFGSL